MRRLATRTERFGAAERTPSAYWAVTRGLLAEERAGRERLSEPVGVCPLAGFLDRERRRVGCLGHPSVTGGVDLRDCGTHGSQGCQAFDCPACAILGEEEARLVGHGCDDWWLYGLVVTDPDFVRACLAEVERAAGRALGPSPILANERALEAMRGLFALRAASPRAFVELGEHPSPRARILAAAGLPADAGGIVLELAGRVASAL